MLCQAMEAMWTLDADGALCQWLDFELQTRMFKKLSAGPACLSDLPFSESYRMVLEPEL